MTIKELRFKIYEKDKVIQRLSSKLETKEKEISYLIELLDRRQLDDYEAHLKEQINKLKEER